MKHPCSVGIMVPSNMTGGVQKLAAVAARDLADNGHQVSLYVPLLPWRFYFISLSHGPKKWLRWARYAGPIFLQWLKLRKFAFQDILFHDKSDNSISVHFVLLRASKKQLSTIDYVLLYTIAQIDDYARRFPQERQIYLLPHPEEESHGNARLFQKMRSDFKGKILVMSPETGRNISDHVADHTVTPSPLSSIFWNQPRDSESETAKKDILVVWKNNESGQQGMDLVASIKKLRPNCSITVWGWSPGARQGALEAMPGVEVIENISERDLCNLYRNHHMFLYPSNFEGFGIPPIEALASGCIPILRPEVGAAELYARNGENSVYIEGSDEEVAKHIVTVLNDDLTLATMRENGYKSIEQFNPNGYGLRILQDAGIIE